MKGGAEPPTAARADAAGAVPARRPARRKAREFPLERRTNYRFSVISTWNMRCLAGLFAGKFGLRTAGWRLLSIIGRFEPIYPSRLAELSTLDADKVTRAADRLVDAGLVDRRTAVDDRRRVVMRLTERGRLVYDEIEQASQMLEAELLAVLSGDERRAFYATMDKLQTQAQRIFTGKDAWKRIVGVSDKDVGSDKVVGGSDKVVGGSDPPTVAEPAKPAAGPAKPGAVPKDKPAAGVPGRSAARAARVGPKPSARRVTAK